MKEYKNIKFKDLALILNMVIENHIDTELSNEHRSEMGVCYVEYESGKFLYNCFIESSSVNNHYNALYNLFNNDLLNIDSADSTS